MDLSSKPTKVILDLSNTKWLEPVGLTFLTGLIYYFVTNNCVTSYISPQDAKCAKYLKKCGFYELFSIQTNLSSYNWQTNVPIKWFLADSPLDFSYITKIQNLIFYELPYNEELAIVLKVSLSELFNNVKDHSESDVGFCATGQWYPQKHKIIITVLDLGLGF